MVMYSCRRNPTPPPKAMAGALKPRQNRRRKMGWTETYYDRKLSHKERREEMDKMFNFESDTKTCEVVRSTIKNNTYYNAVRMTDKATGESEVWAGICLLSERKDGWSYWYGYKDMDETCGPFKYDCPKAILDLLTPTDNELANEWRRKCREKASKPSLSKLGEGSIIEFVSPWDTNYYSKGDTVRLTKKLYYHNLATNRRTYHWRDGSVYWTQKMIPSTFKVIKEA